MDAYYRHTKTYAKYSPSDRTDVQRAKRKHSGKKKKSSFAGRKVKTIKNPQCKLSMYMDTNHSFLRLENPGKKVDILRGLYPGADDSKMKFVKKQGQESTVQESKGPESEEQESEWFTVQDLFQMAQTVLFTVDGLVQNERDMYDDTEPFDDIPHVTLNITQNEAERIEHFVRSYSRACKNDESQCTYKFMGHNCVDFVQEAFSKTGYGGHYVDQFSADVKSCFFSRASCYAIISQLEFREKVSSGAEWGATLMLAAALGKYALPRAKSFVKDMSQWLSGGEADKKTVDPGALKEMRDEITQQVKQCNTVISEGRFPDRNERSTLIDASVEIEYRLIKVDRYIEEEGYAGRHQDFISKELREIGEQLENLQPLITQNTRKHAKKK